MAIVMGPVLGFRGADDAVWRSSALWVLDDADGPPKVSVAVGGKQQVAGAPVALASNQGRTVWRSEWQVPRGNAPQSVQYGIGATSDQYVVSPSGRVLRVGYASCNGFSHPRYMKGVKDPNERWKNLLARHALDPLHLLLLGGDQVYGDSIWSQQETQRLAAWLDKSWKARVKAPFTPSLAVAVERFYFDLYCARWKQPDPALALASIPTLMMWDDHDIFDGWGSYADELQQCHVYQGIFAAARRAFRIFQLQLRDGEAPTGTFGGQGDLGYGHRFGSLAVGALDLRSERSRGQIMRPESWEAALGWIDGLDGPGLDHLLLLTSIPLVYPRFSWIEMMLDLIPGQQELEDDLKDHWTSRPHREERLRLVHRLLAFSRKKHCRVTILSGDVHVAALGSIESDRDPAAAPNANVMNQLISSAIVHTPPPGVALLYLKHVADRVDEVDRGILARMQPFAGTDQRFVAARNWMSLTFDAERRFWTEWWVEGETAPFRKVVHAI